VAASHHVSSYEDRIYEDVQLSARRFLASRTLDQILTDRNEISAAVKKDVSDSASGYGVEVIRGDVKDLVFPGNLREIMNMVIETERRAEARIIEAKNEAEATKIRNDAENESQIAKIEAGKEMALARAEAKVEEFRAELEMRTQEAEALKGNPEMIRILQLQTLQALAESGARIAIGLDGENLRTATDFDPGD
jgi:regulator of protease activity HflC (stomatin/prohibitin superfamily)